MKLTDIETFVVGNPPPHFGGRYFVFVKLTTDGNVSGIGEAYCVPFEPHLVAKSETVRSAPDDENRPGGSPSRSGQRRGAALRGHRVKRGASLAWTS